MASSIRDVVIIGGGPGGSTMGCLLSMAGIDNVIFEGANHPRPHVGESLVPSTSRVLEEIGFIETMEREGFVHKPGAAWHPTKSSNIQSILFRDFRLPGVNQDHSYHVERGKFDLLLLKHAEKLGSKVHQGTHVKEVIFEDGVAKGVRVEIGGESVAVRAKMVVDASGRKTLIGRQLRLVEPDPLFNQYTVHGWFENVYRGPPAVSEHIHIYFMPVERGWVWQIPITNEVTSIGAVAERRVFKQSGGNHEQFFHDIIQSSPDMASAMKDARQVKDFEIEADYSYSLKSYCGDGWVLVGDAMRFVDPIFSSGISVAMHSAQFSCEYIKRGLASGDLSRAQFVEYEDRMRKGTAIWYEFITLYYKLLPLFTYFISKEQYKHDVLRLLSGDVYDRDEVPVLDAMRKYIEAVEASDGHLLKSCLDGEISIKDFVALQPIADLSRS